MAYVVRVYLDVALLKLMSVTDYNLVNHEIYNARHNEISVRNKHP